MILDVINETGNSHLELHAFLNDLPGNDFNTVFKAIPSFYQKVGEGMDGKGRCFVSATPGTFYGRLFPSEVMHFVYSANSLHWLSQVPPELNGENATIVNKGNIGVGKTSSPAVFKSYLAQFRRDFTLSLKSRLEEIVPGGGMVLSLRGRKTIDYSDEQRDPLWSTFANIFDSMIREGVVEEEKVDAFNMPFFEPHIEEVREMIRAEGSFDIIRLEAIPVVEQNFEESNFRPDIIANAVRAVTEPLLAVHFGEAIMDKLFDKFEEMSLLDGVLKAVALVVSLKRKI